MSKDEVVQAVWENTEFCEYTPDDAAQSMEAIRSWGFHVPDDLTAEEFARMYNGLNVKYAVH